MVWPSQEEGEAEVNSAGEQDGSAVAPVDMAGFLKRMNGVNIKM